MAREPAPIKFPPDGQLAALFARVVEIAKEPSAGEASPNADA